MILQLIPSEKNIHNLIIHESKRKCLIYIKYLKER